MRAVPVPVPVRVLARRKKPGRCDALAGIPPAVFEYRLGTRSALHWVIDQYRVKVDKRSGIVSDPNRPDDPGYIVRLVKKVVTVSLETVRVVAALPDLGVPDDD